MENDKIIVKRVKPQDLYLLFSRDRKFSFAVINIDKTKLLVLNNSKVLEGKLNGDGCFVIDDEDNEIGYYRKVIDKINSDYMGKECCFNIRKNYSKVYDNEPNITLNCEHEMIDALYDFGTSQYDGIKLLDRVKVSKLLKIEKYLEKEDLKERRKLSEITNEA